MTSTMERVIKTVTELCRKCKKLVLRWESEAGRHEIVGVGLDRWANTFFYI